MGSESDKINAIKMCVCVCVCVRACVRACVHVHVYLFPFTVKVSHD